MSEIILKVDLEGSGETLQQAIGDLERFKDLLLEVKANKDALATAESIANVKKLTSELKKAELQVIQLQQKANQAREKENQKLKEQSGLLGQLIAKKKELSRELFTAQTVESVRKINGELAKTNLEIVKLKNTGVSSFNTFEKALASFQFKFNFLGNLAANVVSSLSELGSTGAIALFEASKAAGVFGDSIQAATLNTQNLEQALKLAKEAFDAIGKGAGQELATALGDRIEAIGLDILDAERAVREANDIQTRGLEGEDLDKALAARKEANEKLSALRNELIVLENEQIKLGFEKKAQIAKKGTDEEIKIQIQAFQDLILLQKRQLAQRDPRRVLDEEARIADEKQFQLFINRQKKLNELIESLNEELSDRQKKAAEQAKKEKEQTDKQNAKDEQERLKKESDENFRIWSDGMKRMQNETERVNKEINEAILSQQKTADDAQKQQIKEQEDEDDAFLKNKKETTDETLKLAKKGNRDALDILRERAKTEKDIREELALIEENLRKQEIENIKAKGEIIFGILEQQSEARKELLESQLEQQQHIIDTQVKLAEAGRENNLAQAEAERARIQKQQIEQARRIERLKKLEAYFNLFANYARDAKPGEEGQAARKAFTDVILAEVFSRAFAKEGGILGDIMQPIEGGTNDKGLYRGRSHAQGGIKTLLETEGGEGILTKNEVENLGGSKGFYMLKDLLKSPVKDDLIEKQEQSFSKVIPIYRSGETNTALLSELRELKEEFRSIPRIHEKLDGLGNIITEERAKGLIRKVTRKPRQI